MRYISAFSGIEAASVAWHPLGWEALAFSEIDPFACAVLACRFPNVPNLGDISEIDWRRWRGEADVLIGGSPCQSFSTAGDRTGLNGKSRLMYEYARAVREIRPRWFVWENVTGALYSEGGEAFRALLSLMDELGYGMAWRVLDAQYFGVPQRRRRVFLVGHLGEESAAARVLAVGSEGGVLPGMREGARAEDSAPRGDGAGEPRAWGFQSFACRHRAPVLGDCAPTLTAERIGSAVAYRDGRGEWTARHLTPLECERLQGFPDGWTAIEYRGKPAAKTPRIRALGNSFPVPVVRWIGERMQACEEGAL